MGQSENGTDGQTDWSIEALLYAPTVGREHKKYHAASWRCNYKQCRGVATFCGLEGTDNDVVGRR